MKRCGFFLIMAAFVMAGGLVSPARGAGDAKTEAAIEAVKNIHVGVAMETVQLGKKPSSLDYEIMNNSFFIGKREGSRVYFIDNNSDITQDSSTHRFSTTIHAKDYGFAVATRFAALPGQTLTLSRGRKVVHTDSYIDYTWMPLAGAWNPDPLSQAEVHSNPLSISWRAALPKDTRAGLTWLRENVELNTSLGLKVRTTAYTLDASKKWGKTTVGAVYTKYSSSVSQSNTLLELRADYEPMRNAKVTLKAGMYSHGAPTAGGVFSDIGEQYIFSYIAGETQFNPIFNEKIGYISLGVSYDIGR